MQSLRGLTITNFQELIPFKSKQESSKNKALHRGGAHKTNYPTNADSDDRDKLIGYLDLVWNSFCMCCSYYACKLAQHNLFGLFDLFAGHSYVHDKEELSSFILRILI